MPNLTASDPATTIALLAPLEVIESMIELRIQVAQLEQQIQSLQPAFFAACASLNTEKIAHDRATISRRLTPGQWAYAPDVLETGSLVQTLEAAIPKSIRTHRGQRSHLGD